MILQICSCRAGPGTAQDTVPCRAARWAEISGTAQPALRAVPARPSCFRAGPGFVPRFSGRARASPLSTAQIYSSSGNIKRGGSIPTHHHFFIANESWVSRRVCSHVRPPPCACHVVEKHSTSLQFLNLELPCMHFYPQANRAKCQRPLRVRVKELSIR